jgi:hypothetical protein
MIQEVQATIIADARQSVRKLLEAAIIYPEQKEEMIEMALETIEITILNSFWKHGISGSPLRTEKGENA